MKRKGLYLISSVLLASLLPLGFAVSCHQKNISPNNVNEVIETELIFDSSPTINNKLFDEPLAPQINYEDQLHSHWLSDTTISLLKKRILEDLSYGPEIFLLKGINLIAGQSKWEDGSYDPIKHEINIYLNNFESFVPFLEGKYDLVKTEWIFQVLYHEYNHHIMDTYVKQPLESSKATHDIYTSVSKLGKRHLEFFDNDFVNKFKSYLNYDKDIPLTQEAKGVWGEGSNHSIGSTMNAMDLYKYANQKEPNKTKINWNQYSFQGLGKSELGRDHYSISGNDVSYIYSLNELLARKYQQLNMVYSSPQVNGWGFHNNGWVDTKRGPTTSTFFQDTLFYQNHLENNSDRFLFDAPFGNDEYNNLNPGLKDTSSDLFRLLDTYIGHGDGLNVSLILNQDNKLISLFGFTNPEDKYIGYEEDDQMHWFPLTFFDYNFVTKNSLTAKEHLPLDGSKKFYSCSNLEISKLKNQKLFFSKDKIEKIPATNFSFDHLNNSLHESYFQNQLVVEEDQNQVVIREIKDNPTK